MPSFPPTVADFKAQFVRDFVYGATADTVMDADVTQALTLAGAMFNAALWHTDEQPVMYGLVAAHFLWASLNAAGGPSATNYGKGVNAAGGGAVESKTVGGVSVSYAVPDFVRQNPLLGQLMNSKYGQLYLSLVWPRMVGNVQVVSGRPDGEVNVPGQ